MSDTAPLYVYGICRSGVAAPATGLDGRAIRPVALDGLAALVSDAEPGVSAKEMQSAPPISACSCPASRLRNASSSPISADGITQPRARCHGKPAPFQVCRTPKGR